MKKIWMCVVVALLLLSGGWSFSAEIVWAQSWNHMDWTVLRPSIRKLPFAIPFFKVLPGSPETNTAREGADILSKTLEFTGYFMTLDRFGYPVKPDQLDITGASIDFQKWTRIGAEYLVTGGVAQQGDVINLELRLFNVVKRRLEVGKRYKFYRKDLERIIRRFCGEILFQLKGTRGLFESQIAFVSNSTRHKEIYICDFDGKNPVQITHHKSISLYPAWSSNTQWIAYTSYAKGNPDLYIRRINGKSGHIVAKKGINTTPAWVPGQFKLAATLSFSGDQEIYLLTGAGKIIKRLTHKYGIDTSPSFSPDGKRMAFVSDRSGSPQIYIMELETGRVERLTYEGKYNTQPSWSPMGDKIAYSGMDRTGINIYVIGLDGQPPVQLTQGSRQNEHPSWSPDGSMIVFSSTREGPKRLYVMTAYGTDQRRLLAMPGQQSLPQWSPRVIHK